MISPDPKLLDFLSRDIHNILKAVHYEPTHVDIFFEALRIANLGTEAYYQHLATAKREGYDQAMSDVSSVQRNLEARLSKARSEGYEQGKAEILAKLQAAEAEIQRLRAEQRPAVRLMAAVENTTDNTVPASTGPQRRVKVDNRRKHPALTPEQRAQIDSLRQSCSGPQIAERLGVPIHQVYKHFNETTQ